MSERSEVLARLHGLLKQLREGKAEAYLDMYRLMIPHRLTAEDVDPNVSDAELRRLRRECVLREARAALAQLESDKASQYKASQYQVIMTLLASIKSPPEAIGKTHGELLALWRKAAMHDAQGCLAEFRAGQAHASITLLDHLALLDADPEALGISMHALLFPNGRREPWHFDLLAKAGLPLDVNMLYGRRVAYHCLEDGSDAHVRTIRGVNFGGDPDDDPICPGDAIEATMTLVLSGNGPSRESRELEPALIFNGGHWLLRERTQLGLGPEKTVVVRSVRFP